MGYSIEQYRDQLIQLLPPGDVFAARPGSNLYKLLHGLAGEFARVESRADALIRESVISTADELLEEYEKDFGIPEPGDELSMTRSGRIQTLLAKLLEIGQQNKQYFVDIASGLGYMIEIQEFRPAWSGIMKAGDTCGDLSVMFSWLVWIWITEDMKWDISELMRKIQKLRPGHTQVFFRFKGAEFSRAFRRGSFDAIRQYDGEYIDFNFGAEFSSAFRTAYNYIGSSMTGPFGKAFSLAFDAAIGGEFCKGFDSAFSRQT